MTLRQLTAVSVPGGVAAGLLLYALVYAFRDAFAVAHDLGFVAISMRALGIAVVEGVLAGLSLHWFVDRMTEERGAALLAPLLVFAAATLATAVALEWYFLRPQLEILLVPTIAAGAAMVMTAAVRGWMSP